MATADRIVGTIGVAVMAVGLCVAVYGFCVGMESLRVYLQTAKYQSCIDRGGTITEGPFGISCVGINVPKPQ